MGLFDYVYVRCQMPDPRFQDRVFQTKSFDEPFMDKYTITEDGRLIHDDYIIEEIPEEERPGYKDYQRTGKKLFLLNSCIKRMPAGQRDTNHHGDVVFCDWDQPDRIGSELVHWQARFTNGQLESITRYEEDNEDL